MNIETVMVVPFLLLLGAMVILPLHAGKWWHRNYKYLAVGLGSVTAIYYLAAPGRTEDLLNAGHDYVSFIALSASLFVITGGIHIRLKGRATPLANVLMLATGAVLSNVLGTTGASMLLIRPYLRSNRYRVSPFHVIFFIFVVSNIGGALTPIGDPPLFLGFIRGVPFLWNLTHSFGPWLVAVGTLLLVFFCRDWQSLRKISPALRHTVEEEGEKVGIEGWRNFIWIGVVIGSVFIQKPLFLREVIMLAAAFLSYKTTKTKVRESNHFSFAPIEEVAWLFLGIFITMIPALHWLQGHAASLGMQTPTALYFSTGVTSAVLDNAPSYLNFLAAAIGLVGGDVANTVAVQKFSAANVTQLLAISLGACFFGAMTYIGNGPNFMVKAIAEERGVKMPGFVQYIMRFSLPVLLPVLIVVWLLFIV